MRRVSISSALLAFTLFVLPSASLALSTDSDELLDLNENEDPELQLPSSITLTGGRDSQGGSNGALDASVPIRNKWLLGVGAYAVRHDIEGSSPNSRGGYLSVNTDPAAAWQAAARVSAASQPGEWSETLGAADVTFAPNYFDLTAGAETRVLRLQPASGSPVSFSSADYRINGVRGGVSWYGLKRWTFSINGTRRFFQSEFDSLASDVAALYISPDALVAAFGVNEFESRLTVSRRFHRFGVGVEAESATTYLEQKRYTTLQLFGSVDISRSFSLAPRYSVTRSQSDPSESDTNAASLALTYEWY